MSKIKDWLADNIPTVSDEDLIRLGYTQDEIDQLRATFSEED